MEKRLIAAASFGGERRANGAGFMTACPRWAAGFLRRATPVATNESTTRNVVRNPAQDRG